MNRASDWLQQAESDLEMARIAAQAQRHDWACFAAQQAAEKAVKALHLHLGQEASGHLGARLLVELPITAPPILVEKVRSLDALSVPTRYPDAFPAGAPAEHYGFVQTQGVIAYASKIVAFARAQTAEPR